MPRKARWKGDKFLSAGDRETLNKWKVFQHNPKSMFYMSLPAAITVLVGPLAVKINHFTFDWLFADVEPSADLNEALGIYLVPASLIYAMVFGFALQDATSRFEKVRQNSGQYEQIATPVVHCIHCTCSCVLLFLGRHLSLLRVAVNMIKSCRSLEPEQKMALHQHICKVTLSWMNFEMRFTGSYSPHGE